MAHTSRMQLFYTYWAAHGLSPTQCTGGSSPGLAPSPQPGLAAAQKDYFFQLPLVATCCKLTCTIALLPCPTTSGLRDRGEPSSPLPSFATWPCVPCTKSWGGGGCTHPFSPPQQCGLASPRQHCQGRDACVYKRDPEG